MKKFSPSALFSFLALAAPVTVAQTVTFYGSDAAAPSVSTFDIEFNYMQSMGAGTNVPSALNVILPTNMVPNTFTGLSQNYYTTLQGMAIHRNVSGYQAGAAFGSVSMNLSDPDDGTYIFLPDGGNFHANASPASVVTQNTISSLQISVPFGGQITALSTPNGADPATLTGLITGFGAMAYSYSFVPTTAYSSGSWSGGGSFSELTSMPDGAGATVVFPAANAGTVSVDGGRTAGDWLIEGSGAYVFNGPGSITLSQTGRAQVSVSGAGAHTVNAPLHLASNTSFYVNNGSQLNVAGSLGIGSTTTSIAKTGAGSLSLPPLQIANLHVGEGRLRINAGGSTLSVSRVTEILSVANANKNSSGTTAFAGGALDIAAAGSGLVLDYDGSLGFTPIGDYNIPKSVAWMIKNGYDGGDWEDAPVDGDGNKLASITSSAAEANSNLGIGFGPASAILGSGGGTFLGQSVDASTVLTRVVLLGDLNLDGVVNITDSGLAGPHYNTSGKFWYQGDFNYDGLVNLADFSLMYSNWNASVAGSLPRASVPEPSAAILTVGTLGLLARARRTSRQHQRA